MKKILIGLSALFMLGSCAAQQPGPLSEEQRKFARDYLETTKADFLKAIAGLSAQQVTYKPDEKTWSILDIAEHITLAEQRFFDIIEKEIKNAPDSSPRRVKLSEQDIIDRLTNRGFKAKSPESITAKGTFATIADAQQAFEKQRDANIAYISSTNDLLHWYFWRHPATGKIDLYQTIILMAAHSKRHILQMEEVKALPGFPKQ
jgi:hypothetical protein